MYRRRYYMAHDCPQCGAKDAPGEWGGARMSSSAWGHDFSCCSDECGKELAKKVIPARETEEGRKWLRQLWEKLQCQSDARLSGEPYPGYPWR